jgi:hypothetical protein
MSSSTYTSCAKGWTQRGLTSKGGECPLSRRVTGNPRSPYRRVSGHHPAAITRISPGGGHHKTFSDRGVVDAVPRLQGTTSRCGPQSNTQVTEPRRPSGPLFDRGQATNWDPVPITLKGHEVVLGPGGPGVNLPRGWSII